MNAKNLSAWAWIVISAFFTAVSLAMVVVGRKPGPTAILVVFALTSLWISIATFRSRRRLEAHFATDQRVTLPGHVPIQMRRGRFRAIAAGCVGFSVLSFVYGWAISPLFPIVVAPIGIAGVLLLLGIMPFNTPRAFALDEAGVTFVETRGSWIIRWEEIHRVFALVIQENAAVGIDFELPAVLNRVHASDAAFARVLAKRFEKTQTWNGAHVVLMAFAFGVEAGLLVQALTRYAQNAEARAELRAPRLAPETR
ncbi:MAG: hypothetical protein ACKVPX_09470 [Myxococcaceae bacterium]